MFGVRPDPQRWRTGYIVPIPKGSSTGVPNPRKFRGISVLSVVYKIFYTVVRNRLTEMAESNGLLCEEQNGFRKGRGCLDNILMLTLLGSKYSKVGDGLRCGFIDLQKQCSNLRIFASSPQGNLRKILGCP